VLRFSNEFKMQKLDEVLIKKDRVVTIKEIQLYNVNGLKAKKDYTIEEVINRIPGESGQISILINLSVIYILMV
jgi:hypothetical protein